MIRRGRSCGLLVNSIVVDKMPLEQLCRFVKQDDT